MWNSKPGASPQRETGSQERQAAASNLSSDGFDTTLTLDLGSASWEGPVAQPATSVGASASMDPCNETGPAQWPSLEDLDAGFGAILEASSMAQPDGCQDDSMPAPDLRELFTVRSVGYLRALRDLIISIRWDEPVADEVARRSSALGGIKAAAIEAGLPGISRAVDELADALRKAKADSRGAIEKASRERILTAYAQLTAEIPLTVSVEEEQSRREKTVMRALLLQVPEITERTIDKLHAAGFATLHLLGNASASQIASAVDIGLTLASRIAETFQGYRRDVQNVPLTASAAARRDRLTGLVAQLRRAHDRYEGAASAWSSDAAVQKKQLRDARNDVLLQITVFLARHGEFDRLAEVERLSFQGKIELLEEYVDQAADE
jgi:hypothetical protein